MANSDRLGERKPSIFPAAAKQIVLAILERQSPDCFSDELESASRFPVSDTLSKFDSELVIPGQARQQLLYFDLSFRLPIEHHRLAPRCPT